MARWPLPALIACGCVGLAGDPATSVRPNPPDVGDPGAETGASETGASPATAETGTSQTGTGGPFGAVEVSCPTPTTIRYHAVVSGPVAGGIVFQQETGNAEPQWSDEHDLAGIAAAPDGAWIELEAVLDDGSTLVNPFGDWVRSESTAFTCAAHIDGPGSVMSYAFAAFDASGTVVACVAFGGDPEALIAGTSQRVFEPSFPLGACLPR